jgi:hypothetical protein
VEGSYDDYIDNDDNYKMEEIKMYKFTTALNTIRKELISVLPDRL